MQKKSKSLIPQIRMKSGFEWLVWFVCGGVFLVHFVVLFVCFNNP